VHHTSTRSARLFYHVKHYVKT